MNASTNVRSPCSHRQSICECKIPPLLRCGYLLVRPQDIALPPPPSFITHYWRPSPRRSYQTEVDLPTISLHSADIPDHVTTTLLESRTTIEAGTTGLRTWRASFVLARYLIAHPGRCTFSEFAPFLRCDNVLTPLLDHPIII